tara:strand:- start:3331 stop:3957 length:627 start_codon:yes stop_codon:yes gene_type:complete
VSYILKALQRRAAQQNPQTATAEMFKRHNEQRLRLIGGGLAAALLINGTVLVWLYDPFGPKPANQPATSSAPAEPAAARRQQTPAPQSPVQASPDLPADPDATSPPAETSPAATVAPVIAPAPAPPTPRRRTLITSLPSDAKARFPGLTFSTHVFAEDASLRAVVVNGTRLTEGDAFSGIRMEQITETGVVVAFESYLVEIPVIAQWQ